MNLDDLTEKDWDELLEGLNRCHDDMLMGKTNPWDRITLERYLCLFEDTTDVFYKIVPALTMPFQQIPVLMNNATERQKAILSFRLNRGI